MSYSSVRPVGRRNIISYWAIPDVQRLHIFKADPNGAKRHRVNFVSIDIKNKTARISKGAAQLMELKEGKRFVFLTLGDRVYCSMSNAEGNKLSIATRGDMQIRCSNFIQYIKNNFTISQTFKCGVLKTRCYFDGFVLYELEFPYDKKRKYGGRQDY